MLQDRPACNRCRHFYITYDPQFPYGCRAMAFKSKQPPYKEVEQHAGLPCQTFAPRPTGTPEAT